MRKLNYEQRRALINQDFSENFYFQNNPKYFNEVIDFLQSNDFQVKGLQGLLNGSKNYICKWIDSLTPELSDSFYTVMTKCYWLLHNLREYPKCIVCGKPIAKKRNTKLFELYPKTCCNKCRYLDAELWKNVKSTKKDRYGKENYMAFGQPEFKQRIAELHNGDQNWNNSEQRRKTCKEKYGYNCVFQVPEVKAKIANTTFCNYGISCLLSMPEFHKYSSLVCFDRYGYENFSQVPEIRSKQAKKYIYENRKFDSKPEIAYYIWLIDHRISFEYQPNISFEYEYNGKTHQYVPDFIVNGKFIEIKGDQFFKDDGTMQNPYDHSQDGLYEAKQQCMLKHDVEIMKSNQYIKYLSYVNDTYGSSYLKQFKQVNS